MGPGMGMGMQMRPEMKQKLILAPRMIQSMEILQLPIMALQERIERELQENPVMEPGDRQDARDEDEEAAAKPEEKFDTDGPLVIDSNDAHDFDRLDAINRDWEDH